MVVATPAIASGVLMFAVALIGASRPVLTWDEIATADAATRTPGQLWHLISHVDGVFLFVHCWTALAGTASWPFRCRRWWRWLLRWR
jgi:mannosyltransferase